MPKYQVMRFQTIAPSRPARTTSRRDDREVDHPLADGLRDVGAEHEGGDEVEERRPDDGLLRREDARRDDGGDRVGGVVEAVEEVEDQRDEDDEDDQAEASVGIAAAQAFLITTLPTTWVKSLQRSQASSRPW